MCQKNFFDDLIFLYVTDKMVLNNEKETYYQRNWVKILQKARDYDESNKERIKEYRRNKYSTLTIEDKKIKQEKWRQWYSKLDDEKKNKIRNASKERYHKLINLLALLQSGV